MPVVAFGLDRVVNDLAGTIRGRRFGLLANHASVDHRQHFVGELLAEQTPNSLTSIFSPQHGLWSEEQANMIESGHQVHPRLGVPIYSLYSETREPTPEMLAPLELFVIDLQDVGTRVYTFIWTMLLAMHACAKQGIPVIVLDRPNPLEGDRFEGPLLESEYQSFVGLAEIPMRHGMTIGELALLFRHEQKIDVDLEVIQMEGWTRATTWEETGRPWIGPSPNVPSLESVRMYPGQVLLEGITLSEGRGTTLPFQVTGAPEIDEHAVACQIAEHLSAPACRPTRFVPTFDKFQDQSCRGIRWFIADHRHFEPFKATIVSLGVFRDACEKHFAWLKPPYEYETVKPPIDILYGSPSLRETLNRNTPLDRDLVEQLCWLDQDAWADRIDPFLLYR